MIKHVVFDFDGTLVDSNEIKIDAFAEIAKEFDRGLEALAAVRGDGGPQGRFAAFERFSQQIGASDPVRMGKDLAARYSQLCEDRISCCPSCPGAPEVIGALRDMDCKVYLNSATPEVALLPILRRRGWLELFDKAKGLPVSKTENLLIMMKAVGARPEECVVIGDKDDDAQSAAAYGCRYISYGCGRAGFDLDSLAGLPALLKTL